MKSFNLIISYLIGHTEFSTKYPLLSISQSEQIWRDHPDLLTYIKKMTGVSEILDVYNIDTFNYVPDKKYVQMGLNDRKSGDYNVNFTELFRPHLLIFEKMTEDVVIPTRAKTGDAAMDLIVLEFKHHATRKDVYFGKTGLKMQIPEGYYGMVKPRSSTFVNYDFEVHVGTIDSGYRGEVCVLVKGNIKDVKVPARIAQLLIIKVEEPITLVDRVDDSERGTGGFGSTGN